MVLQEGPHIITIIEQKYRRKYNFYCFYFKYNKVTLKHYKKTMKHKIIFKNLPLESWQYYHSPQLHTTISTAIHIL